MLLNNHHLMLSNKQRCSVKKKKKPVCLQLNLKISKLRNGFRYHMSGLKLSVDDTVLSIYKHILSLSSEISVFFL